MTETKRWTKGGVLVEFREDGSLHIYAPDDSRVLGESLIGDLVDFLISNYPPMQTADFGPVPEPPFIDGATLDGIADGLTDTEIEADLQAAIARLENDKQSETVQDAVNTATADSSPSGETVPSGVVTTVEPSFQELRDTCKAFGLAGNGTKAELQARLNAAGIKRGQSSD